MTPCRVVVRMKCGASHTYQASNTLDEGREILQELLDVMNKDAFIPVDYSANTWYVNRDEVREIRIEDSSQRVIKF